MNTIPLLSNPELWKKIEAYNFDEPISEYGFSTRLAKENFWTIDFTQKAMLEYKKFMYLAAISDLMVSPSEIVDTVWHQHLIFTQSYADFCRMIGKDVQHIPSTHNRAEFEKFKLAKERTKELYQNNFGEQLAVIWQYPDMFASLQLTKAKIKIRTFLIIAIIGFLILIYPFYLLLSHVYIHIDNPYFVIGYIALAISAFIIIEWYNRMQLLKAVNNWNSKAFIFHLSALELLYLKGERVSDIIHGYVNRLIEENKIKIESNRFIPVEYDSKYESIEEYNVMETIKNIREASYPLILAHLMFKPCFNSIAGAIDAFRKYFIKSRFFVRLFSLNFILLFFVWMLGVVRLIMGVERDKPVTILGFVLFVMICLIGVYLWRLPQLIATKIIPSYYEREIVNKDNNSVSPDWHFYLMGTARLLPVFSPYVEQIKQSNQSGSDSSGGSGCGGASCGGASSCGGGGCGGCGGGD